MTGNGAAANWAMGRTVEQAAGRIGQMRDRRQAKCWLFAKARECCRQASASPELIPPPDEAVAEDRNSRQVARLFGGLPEDERCALVLFYLSLFEPDELANLMEIKPAALGPLLMDARQSLQRQRHLCIDLLTRAALRRQQLVPPATE
jgi:DNA-directed RNA polymerase specialized sigma24 family protein